MRDPKPVRLTQMSESDYKKSTKPENMIVVGDLPGNGQGPAGSLMCYTE